MDEYAAGLEKANTKTALLKAGTIALNTVLAAVASLIITVVITAISNEIHKVEELQEKAISSAEELQKTNDSLANLAQQYKNLYEASGGTWNTTTLETVRDIQSQIVDLVGDQ